MSGLLDSLVTRGVLLLAAIEADMIEADTIDTNTIEADMIEVEGL
jgi:hypothetical protein